MAQIIHICGPVFSGEEVLFKTQKPWNFPWEMVAIAILTSGIRWMLGTGRIWCEAWHDLLRPIKATALMRFKIDKTLPVCLHLLGGRGVYSWKLHHFYFTFSCSLVFIIGHFFFTRSVFILSCWYLVLIFNYCENDLQCDTFLHSFSPVCCIQLVWSMASSRINLSSFLNVIRLSCICDAFFLYFSVHAVRGIPQLGGTDLVSNAGVPMGRDL